MLHLCAGEACLPQGLFKCLRFPGGERQTDVANENHSTVCSFLSVAFNAALQHIAAQCKDPAVGGHIQAAGDVLLAGGHREVLRVDLHDHLFRGQGLQCSLRAAEGHVHQPFGLHRELIGGRQIHHLHTAGRQVHGLGLQTGAVKAEGDGGNVVQQVDVAGQLNGQLIDLVQGEGGQVDGADGQGGQRVDLFRRAGHFELLAAELIHQHRRVKVAGRVDEAHVHRQGGHLVHLQGHVHAAFFQLGVLKVHFRAAGGVEPQRRCQGDRAVQLAGVLAAKVPSVLKVK